MHSPPDNSRRLGRGDLLQLKRWNTPTIYNGWEQVTRRSPGADAFNREETRDFMPQMGPMVGHAVTVVVEPGNPAHRSANPAAGAEYRRYVAGIPGPKIVVLRDLGAAPGGHLKRPPRIFMAPWPMSPCGIWPSGVSLSTACGRNRARRALA